ncbi:class I SAM-dependent methyltransferase [Rhodospirillaceae bacterium SYSU D60014]|uniref:SAM-dependent methyltransferase n=1 Tax=Virgifigura deserti TaxID=2268457 RepID=UPI000E66CF8A
MIPSPYYETEAIEQRVREGRHRDAIGGMWEEIGQLQVDFLCRNGLRPGHRLLDIGCGSLRAGVRLVAYLEPDHYWGTDLNSSLLDAGYNIEIQALGLTNRLSRSHLVCDTDFSFPDIRGPFDYVLAQSVFTHLPFNHFRRCLARLRPITISEGRLFATFFICPNDQPIDQPFTHQPGARQTTDIADPFHYRAADLAYGASETGWNLVSLGDWNHPRGQKIAIFSPA